MAPVLFETGACPRDKFNAVMIIACEAGIVKPFPSFFQKLAFVRRSQGAEINGCGGMLNSLGSASDNRIIRRVYYIPKSEL